MMHGIEVHLSANIDKYKQSMDAAKKIGSDSMGFIASIFDKIKSIFGGMWDSFKSLFSNMDKAKDKMGEVDDKSTGLATKIGVGLVAAFVAATAAIAVFVKKGLEADAALAKLAISSDNSVATFSRFDAVAAKSGMSVTDFGGSMSKLHDEMKKAAAADDAGIFDKLGVKIVDANNALLKTDEVTIEVAKKIAAMSSEAEKYDAAAKVGFAGKVQVLEDIAHASELSAKQTDEQAAAVVRLGKIWHEILPSGKSMWDQVSDSLTTNMTPAMTEASLAILKSKNEIVAAFDQIFGTSTLFPAFAAKVKEWSLDVSKWFSKVAESSASAQISIMKFLAEKTGLGDPNAYVRSAVAPGFVPPAVVLTSGKNDPIITDAEKELRKQFEATNKTIGDRIEIMKRQIQVGETLTEGQRALLQLDNTALKLSPEERAADLAKINTLIALEKQFKAGQEARAAGMAASKKEEEAYAHLIAAIHAKTEENRLELAVGQNATEGQKMQIKMDQELASGKLKLSAAHLAVAQAALVVQAASEQALKLDAAQRDVTKYIAASTLARDESSAALAVEYAMYGKTADARAIAMVALDAEKWKEAELIKLREEKKPITDQVIAQLNAEKSARILVGQATMAQTQALGYVRQLEDENKKFGIDYILDEKARAAASLKIDVDAWQEKIKNAVDGTEAQKLLEGKYSTWYQNQLLKPQLDADKAMWGSIESTAHDTFISIFDSGKSAFNRLRDTLKNGLLDLLYQMTIKKWIFNIGASVGMTGGASGMAQAAGSAGGIGNGISAISGASSLFNTGGSMIASAGNFIGSSSMSAFGAGFAGNSAGMVTSAAETFANAGMAVESSAASLGATFAAAMPYLAAAVAVYAVWKSMDTSGTYHTGGASSASAAGVTTVRAESLNFEATRVNAETEKMTAALASGIVNILDSTATAFGKTAGYTAATAFADDTSKDGAWGGLVISKLGDKILDWQDTKTGSWAPKVFADGEAGKTEYLAAISTSVRTALDGIGLPAWAQTMLDKVGSGASIEDLGKVVDNINATEHALVIMGDKLAGFASMSDGAVSALIAASGGIDALATSASSYYDNFYSDAEKTAGAAKQVSDALAAVGLAMPANRDAYRAQVEAQMALGEAAAPTVAVLLKNSAAFAQLSPVMESLATSTQSATDALAAAAAISKEQRGLDIQLMTAMGDAEGALAATRSDALASMLSDQARVTQQQIWSAEAASAAIAKAQETAAAQQAANAAATQSFGNALVGAMDNATAAAKAMRAFNDSLLLGNLSSLSKGAQYDVAKQSYIANGDQASASAFLQASQAKGSSKLDYARDFATVIAQSSKAAGEMDAYAARIPAFYQSIADSEAAAKKAESDAAYTRIYESIVASRAIQGSATGSIPAHANGGIASGWSIVGENGPELANFTQPARIYTAPQTRAMMGGASGGNADLKDEISQMRSELNSALQAIALNTSSSARHSKRTSDTLQMVTRDGTSLVTTTKE